ncbi:prenyltransferase [Tibeticola sp.]|uniref:prenyltransferase n=1 Tax=Tibeticola sp. TaxID=2005368 RepID=UPI0025D11E41|nr:prenyltransferase [Tibeticola sp.]
MPTPTNTPPLSFGLALRMTRPGFLLITAVGVVLGLASASACGCGFSSARAAAALLLALLAHAAANVLNDAEDARNGADAANTAGLYPFTGGARLIQNGQVTVEDTRRLALALLALVVPGGLLLAVYSGGGLVLIGLAGLALGWAYSAPPLALMSRGLGELAVAAAWWLVVVGADYSQRGQFLWVPAASALSYAMLVANVLLINGVPDAPADAQVGKHTLAVRLGPRGAAGLYLLIALAAHAWLALGVWAQVQPVVAAWGLVSLPVSLAAAALFIRHAGTPQSLRPAIVLTIAAATLHGLAMAAGFVAMAHT